MQKVKPSIISFIIIKNTPEGPRYLLIKRTGKNLFGEWKYVSGAIEGSENTTEAALRELYEETSLIPSRMYHGDFVESFYEPVDGFIYFCSVFVGFIDNEQKIYLNPKEHDQYSWLSFSEAIQKSVHSNQKQVLEHVDKTFIQNPPKDHLRLSLRRFRNPLIETDRLNIYSPRKDDLVDLYRLLSDPDVMRFSKCGQLSIEEVKKMYIESSLEAQEAYVISLKDHKFIGLMMFFPIVIQGVKHIEFMYRLAKPFWNCGYATEAGKALVSLFKEKKRDFLLISSVEKENHSSINLAKKLGAKFYKNVNSEQISYEQYVYGDF